MSDMELRAARQKKNLSTLAWAVLPATSFFIGLWAWLSHNPHPSDAQKAIASFLLIAAPLAALVIASFVEDRNNEALRKLEGFEASKDG